MLWISFLIVIIIKWILIIMCLYYLENLEFLADLLWKWRVWVGNGILFERIIKSFKKCGRLSLINGIKDDILWKKWSRMGEKFG